MAINFNNLPDPQEFAARLMQMRNSMVNKDNWLEYAAMDIQRQQADIARQGGEAAQAGLPTSRQIAIQEAYRQLGGVMPETFIPQAGGAVPRDLYQETRNKRLENPFVNFRDSLANTVVNFAAGYTGLLDKTGGLKYIQKGTDVIGLTDVGDTPWHEQVSDYNKMAYGGGGISGFLGRGAGNLANVALTGGFGGTAPAAGASFGKRMLSNLPTAMGFGLSTGGSTFTDVAQQRVMGRDISGLQEYGAAALNAIVETGVEMFGMEMMKGAGRVLGAKIPAIQKAIAAGNATKAGKLLLSTFTSEGAVPSLVRSSIGGGLEEAATQIGQNLVRKYVMGIKEQGISEGLGEATAQGAIAPLFGGGFYAFNRGGQAQQSGIDQTQQPSAPVTELQRATALEEFANDPNIPTETKVSVLQQIDQAEKSGEAFDVGQVLQVARQQAVEQTQETAEPAKQIAPEKKLDTISQRDIVSKTDASTDTGGMSEIERLNQQAGLTVLTPDIDVESGKLVNYKLNETDNLRKGKIVSQNEQGVIIRDETTGNQYQIKNEVGLIQTPENAPQSVKIKKTATESVSKPIAQSTQQETKNPVVQEAQKILEQQAQPQEMATEAKAIQEKETVTPEPTKAKPAKEGPRGSLGSERMFNLALQNRISDLEPAERVALTRAKDKTVQAKLIRQAREGDMDAALQVTAANMGAIKRTAERIHRSLSEKSDTPPAMSVDELISEGATAMLQTMRGEASVSLGGKGTKLAKNLLEKWDPTKGSLSTYLLGGGTTMGPVARRMMDLAIGQTAGIEARTTKPTDRSVEAFAELDKSRQLEESVGTQEEQGKRREVAGQEAKPLSTEGIDVVETAKKMLAEGKSEDEVKAFVKKQVSLAKKQGIQFLPDAVARMQKGESPAVESETPSVALKQAIKRMHRFKHSRDVKLVEPITKAEKMAIDFASSIGVEAGFISGSKITYRGVSVFDEKTNTKAILLESGMDKDSIIEVVVHEAFHNLNLDHVEITNSDLLSKARTEALRMYQESGLPLGTLADLDNEATALLAGKVARDPQVRAALFNENPKLYQKVWNAIKDAMRKFTDWVTRKKADGTFLDYGQEEIDAVIELLTDPYWYGGEWKTDPAMGQTASFLPKEMSDNNPVVQKIVKQTGYTTNALEAQFISPDGRYIKDDRSRYIVHADRFRDAGINVAGDDISTELRQTGLIRVGNTGEAGRNLLVYVQMANEPNQAQAAAIMNMARQGERVMLSAVKPRTRNGANDYGQTLGYKEIDALTPTDIIKAYREVVTSAKKLDVQFLPKNNKPNKEIETDVNKFQTELNSILKESPKVTGRPQLANPMDTEVNRRLMDYVDKLREKAGLPLRRVDGQVEREAQRLLQDKKEKRRVIELAKNGQIMTDTEVLAIKEVLNEEATKAIKNPTLTNIMEIQRIGSGYRDSGSSTARALRIRYDRIKKPADRLKEFVVGAITELPQDTRSKIKQLEQDGKQSQADKLRQRYGEEAVLLLEKWKKKGIDVDNLTEQQASSQRVMSMLMADVSKLQTNITGWDVVHEIRRNNLMYSAATQIRNTIGNFYSIADVFITKPIARAIKGVLTNQSTRGETAAAIYGYTSNIAWARAFTNANLTLQYEIPQLETQIMLAEGKNVKGVSETEIYSKVAITGKTSQKIAEKLTEVLTGSENMAQTVGAITGKSVAVAGRIQRVPQALNGAVDEVFKTLHIHSEVAAHAVAIGKQNGLKVGSQQMQQFIDEQLMDMNSESWNAAVDSGESWRASFQGEASKIEKIVMEATSKDWGTIGNVLRMFIPFRKTPIQLAGQAAMHVPGVGAVRMVQRTVQSLQGKSKYTADEFSRHAAQQIIGMIATGLLWDWFEGDDDDDKKDILITGGPSYARQDIEERKVKEQVKPPMAIRWRGKWYNYGYLEPFSQFLGTLATTGSEIKKARKTGNMTDAAKRSYRKLIDMYSDQTYLKTLGDLRKVFSSESSEYDVNMFMRNFAGSWLPNMVDTVLRDQDPYIREKKLLGIASERPSFAKQVQREMFPTQSIMPPPKVDFFGNDIKVEGQMESPTTMFMVRLLSPIQKRQTLTGKQFDVMNMLVKYNENKTTDESVWLQAPPRKVKVRYRNQPTAIYEDMNEDEYYIFTKLSGKIAGEQVEKRQWNTDNPTDKDIMKLVEVFRASRSAVREAVTGARQAKANGDMERYEQIMDDLRDRIGKENMER